MPKARASSLPDIATLMATVSGVGALLALSFAVAPVRAARLDTFVILSVDVLFPGSIVWMRRRVGVNQLLVQISLASWVLFLLNLVSPMGRMLTMPSTLELAVLGIVVTSVVVLGIRKAVSPAHIEHIGWWLLARAVSWNLLGSGLLLMPLEITFSILTKNSFE